MNTKDVTELILKEGVGEEAASETNYSKGSIILMFTSKLCLDLKSH